VPPPLEVRVAVYAARHELLPAGRPVLALVSGGPDSTCLMHVLAEIHDGPLAVLTVDHGLRPEAAEEAEGVLRAARALGLPAVVRRLRLPPGPGAPARARAGRLAAAAEAARELGGALVATGHTASDQAETVLFRMARGTGRTGALGMAPRRGDLVRPLLAVSAAETRAWCRARGLAVAADPGNDDPAFTRARVRHGLLPALRSVHPGAEAHVAALADVLRDEAALVDGLVAAAWERCAAGGPGLDAAALGREAQPLRPLVVRRLLAGAGLPGDALAAEPVARCLALALGPGGGCAALPGGLAARAGGRLVAHRGPAEAPPPAGLSVPGQVRFGAVALSAAPGAAELPSPHRVALRVEGPLEVRSPADGDRLPLPGGGRQAVGRLLAAAGVPAALRPLVPVVVSGGRPVWVAGHRAAPDLLARPGERATVLEVAGA
jgi:tRNA(Ile)-lysidine synthase